VSDDKIIENKKITSMQKFIANLPPIYISLFILLVLVVFLYIGNHSFLSKYNLKVLADGTTILLCVGMGQVFVILTGGIDLSIGGVMSLVAVVFLSTIEKIGFLAFPLAIAIGASAGIINGIIYTKLRIPSFITTLGTNGIFVSITYLIAAVPISAPGRVHHYLDIVNGKIGGINQGWLIALALFLIFLVIQRYTYIGKKIIAIGSNELMCKMSGVDVMSAKIVAFMMSGIGSAVGAVILSSYLYSAYPTIGEVYILESIAVVVVGGTAMTGGSGGIVNTLVGAVIMSMLKNGMTIIGIDVYAQQTFLGVLIILAVAASFDRKKLSFIK
jgi:ribose/xylose/arabinose/galactoside ABC-type transport system permease subunit